MNIILGFIALAACTFVGYLYSTKYSSKKNFYQSFVFFNSRLLSEVSFAKKPIIAILAEKDDKNDNFYNILKERFKNNEMTNSTQNEYLEKLKFLSQDEKNVVYEYLGNIGGSDRASQLLYLQTVEKQIKERLLESTEEEKKYKSLYVKMGFLIGLAVFIIIL